jgi:chromosome partitioning protein
VSDGEDLVSRARSIFARLRDDVEDEPDDAASEPSANGIGAIEPVPEPMAEPAPEPVESEVAQVPPEPAVEPPPEAPTPPLHSVDTVPEAVVEVPAETEPALPERLVEPEEIPEPVIPAVEAEAPARPARALPRVIAVANQKGGVGKTTTAVNLGAALAELGYRVLVVDLDPQGNATTGLGINPRNVESSVYDVVMNGSPVEDAVEPTAVRNLFVVPATIDLAGAEIELVPAFSRELKLRRALEDATGDFDFTLIDCPPSLGLLTVNGLAAATEVLVPIQCEYYALEGLGQLLKNVSLVQSNLNPRLELSTIVLTMYDARTRLAEQVAREVREHFGDTVCRTIVPRTVRLSEAPSFGQPVIVFDSSSRGALAYRELAKEVSGGTPQRTG